MRVGEGAATGLSPSSFDLVVSIGTITYVGYEPFLAEVARVTKPGGLVAVTGGTTGSTIGHMRWALSRLAEGAGLRVERFVDITSNVIQALDADVPRRERLVATLPRAIQAYAREWSDLPGAQRHANCHNGSRCSFAMLLRR